MMNSLKLALVTAGLGGAALSHAVLAYSTFGPGDSYDGSAGYTISGGASTGYQSIALQFVSAATGVVDDVRVATFYVTGANSATVSLYADSGSDTIGALITSWAFGPMGAISVINNSDNSAVLANGNKYWLAMVAGASDTWGAWNLSAPPVNGAFAFDSGSGYSYIPSIQQAAFDVTVVPEPASMACLGLGAAALLRRRRK